MFGWSISARACRSASKRAITCRVSMPGLMTFRATLRRTGWVCSAMKTMPMPPSPIGSSSLYGPIDRARSPRLRRACPTVTSQAGDVEEARLLLADARAAARPAAARPRPPRRPVRGRPPSRSGSAISPGHMEDLPPRRAARRSSIRLPLASHDRPLEANARIGARPTQRGRREFPGIQLAGPVRFVAEHGQPEPARA